jgi:hypothetical protein
MFDKILQFLTYYIISHLAAPYKYTSFTSQYKKRTCDISSEIITVLSANVFQNNMRNL